MSKKRIVANKKLGVDKNTITQIRKTRKLCGCGVKYFDYKKSFVCRHERSYRHRAFVATVELARLRHQMNKPKKYVPPHRRSNYTGVPTPYPYLNKFAGRFHARPVTNHFNHRAVW